MAERLIVILSVLTLFFSESQSQNLTDDNHLRESVARKGQARIITSVQNSKTIAELSRFVSISSVKGKSVEIVISPLTIDWFITQKLNYQIIESDDSKKVMTAACFNQAIGWDLYPTYTQYDSIMQSFSTLYPSLCHLDTIGTSINGKLVLVLKISDNAGTDEDEPETFYSSTIHGDETGGFVLMLRFADYLLKNYPADTRVTNLIDNLEIWINPLANPDGTYRNGDTIISPTRDNANGYDLNRNFPDPITPNTVKQQETLDMIKFMRSHHFVLSANFHSGAEVVNYPWDRWDRLHADNEWFYSISRKYADTVHANSYPGYMTDLENGITNGADWYIIYGGRQDFVTYELQGREVTIELDDTHVTPAADLNSLWQYNWRSLLKTHVLPKIGRVEPNKITRGDLRELLEAIRAKSPITANDALKIVRWIFARAIEADLVTASPAVGLRKPTKETPRDRVATDAELRALWTEGLKHGSYGAAIRLAMLTAARREEIFSMQWGEIDDEARVWRIPAARTKNARPHDVPITDAMAEILATLKPSDANKRQAEPWVFRGRHIGKALRPTFRTWARILEGAQISGLSFHDIRRSVRDRLTRDLEVPFPIAEGIIGHAPSRLTLTYNPSGVSLREMASALSRWASTLDAIVRNKKAEKVVRIAR